MSNNTTTMTSLADALEVLSGILRELAVTPVPSSPEKSSVGMTCSVDEYGSVRDIAERFHYSISGITPYLCEGVQSEKITKLAPALNQGGRNGEARYNMREVENYLKNMTPNSKKIIK